MCLKRVMDDEIVKIELDAVITCPKNGDCCVYFSYDDKHYKIQFVI